MNFITSTGYYGTGSSAVTDLLVSIALYPHSLVILSVELLMICLELLTLNII